jgi:quercetin dioxygenase-like cupin family protein
MKIIHKDDIAPVVAQGDDIKGVTIRVMVSDKDGAPNFALRVFDVEPGGNTPFHTHAWEHEVYILSGNGKVNRENDSVELKPGTALYIEPDEKHNFVAGDDGMSFICVIPSEQKCCADK